MAGWSRGGAAADAALAAVLVADLLVAPQRLALSGPGGNMVFSVMGCVATFKLLTNWDKFRRPQPV